MPRPTLKQGMRSPDVKTLQAMLNKAVVPPPKLGEDGVFGVGTLNALTTFQRQSGLKPDGVAGPHTWAVLESKGGKVAGAAAPLVGPPASLASPVLPKSDPTGTLPSSGSGRRLGPGDIDAAARALGVEPAAVHAVADVESSGRSGFDPQGRPKILFEAHHFRKYTHHKFDKDYPYISHPYVKHDPNYKLDQWGRMYAALALDVDAAIKSASWGMFQVLGSNHTAAGWASPKNFALAMFESEANHLKAFLGYCSSIGLAKDLKSHDWAAFARGYNGESYADYDYDNALAKAYARYSQG